MNRRTIVIMLCMAALATGALAFAGPARQRLSTRLLSNRAATEAALPVAEQPTSATAAFQQSQRAGSAQTADNPVPEFVVYRQLFRHVAFLKQKADDVEKKGADGSALRGHYKQQAKLNDREAQVLDDVAAACNADVERLDRKAKKLVDEFRAKHPGGRLAAGEVPPTPPAELNSLWEERNRVVMQAREALRAAFGEQEFQRFDEHVRQGITPNIKPVKLNPSNIRMPEHLRRQPRN